MDSVITRPVAFFIYPKFNLIDLSGPLEAFGIASSMEPGCYRVTVMSLAGGDVGSSTGVKVFSQGAGADGRDTFGIVWERGVLDGNVAPAGLSFRLVPAAGVSQTARACVSACLPAVT